ncbi:(2Fe-2S) ferredoxin domain-containing protein [uncultured Tenacibaculum sp.]|uniref:(2Fe-2S) ferredoxin domain-containing protein n=1 Tax=uncultured Tenacibaculum sp. TaxID=174713 RepID=UPI00261483FA|nr:(2Fe-2S) ferredoxin domain-containing protein [uncultured Tenacibaculum sp.]
MGKDVSKATTTFLFCDGGSCKKAKSEMAVREARAHLRNEGLWNSTHSIRTRCNGRCEDAPTWIVQPGNYWYKNVTPEKAVEIIDAHINEDKPIDSYLLYKDGDEAMDSDNERTVKPIVFNEKEDKDYGNALVARSPASDQFLYPLFKKLFETSSNVQVNFPNGNQQTITQSHQVTYTDDFDIVIEGPETNLKLAIGPITKAMENDVTQEIKDRKVGVAEVIWKQKDTNHIAHIRLKNRKGKFLVSLDIPKNNSTLWEYILSIYLSMDSKNPKIVLPVEQ